MESRPFKYNNRYTIYSDGRIYDNKEACFLSISRTCCNKCRVFLTHEDGVIHNHVLKRVIAEHFIQDITPDTMIYQKDGNIYNVDVSNLVCMTRSEYYSAIKRGKNTRKAVIGYIDGKQVRFNNLSEAGAYLEERGLIRKGSRNGAKSIHSAIMYKHKAAGSYWSYADED